MTEMPRKLAAPKEHPVRVVTYNLLQGGDGRTELIARVLSRLDADVIALQEIRDPALVERLARDLDMTLILGPPSDRATFHLGILTRLPVQSWRNHRHPRQMLRSHLECTLGDGKSGGDRPGLRVHCVHLAARFGERAHGETRRLAEIEAIMGDIEHAPERPHLILGDFNSIAPGDDVAATAFLQRMRQLRRANLLVRDENGFLAPVTSGPASPELDAAWSAAGIDPKLGVGVPSWPGVFSSITGMIPNSRRLDARIGKFVRRWVVDRVLEAGYTDCYRAIHPRANGFTCATWAPTTRIDYVFASEDLAPSLLSCDVVGARTWPDHDAHVASDHFPLVADFDIRVT